MPWVRLDDHFDEHRKVDSMSDAAFRVFIESLCISNRSLFDGRFETASAHKRWPRRAIKELVARGLWEETEDGYLIHDYEQYQPTSEQVLAERSAARQRMKDLRVKRGKRSGEHRENKQRTSGEVQPQFDGSSVTPDPVPEGSTNPSGGGAPQNPDSEGVSAPPEWDPQRFIQRRGSVDEAVSDE